MGIEEKKIITILNKARSLGISVVRNEDALEVSMPDGVLEKEELLDKIRRNRESIVNFLKNAVSQPHSAQPAVPEIIKAIRPRPSNIPLSFAQNQLWLIDQIGHGSKYHISIVLYIGDQINRDALNNALSQIVRRHEALRTVILQEDGMPYQKIISPEQWEMNYLPDAVSRNESHWHEWLEAEITRPFKLAEDYMLRAHLVESATAGYVLVIVMHHIVSDGWSMNILIDELMTLYSADNSGRPVTLPALPFQYADYAIWQRKRYTEEALKNKLDWWERELKDSSPFEFPTDFSRSLSKTEEGKSVTFHIESAITEKLSSIANEEGATLYMVLFAAFNVLLYRYTQQEDISIGTSFAGRTQTGVEKLIGCFVNTLVLRTQIEAKESFLELLRRMKRKIVEVYAMHEVPFELVVGRINPKRNMGQSSLFQIMFEMNNVAGQNTKENKTLYDETKIFFNKTSQTGLSPKFDILVGAIPCEEGLNIDVEYRSDLFRECSIKRLFENYRQLLISLVEDPSKSVNDLEILKDQEKLALLNGFNCGDRIQFPKGSILDLFERQVSERPASIAVIEGARSLSYTTLDEKSKRIARYLVIRGVKANVPVGVYMERSVEMLVSILGIFRAGGTYFPIDPEYPPERTHQLISDTGVEIILTSKTYEARLRNHFSKEAFVIDGYRIEIDETSKDETDLPSILPDDLAYLIFTSGSTGKPKGVMIEHGGMMNHLLSKVELFRIDKDSKVVQNASQVFDISIWQFLAALIRGGSTAIYPQNDILDPQKFLGSMETDGWTHVEVVPSYLQVLLDAFGDRDFGFSCLKFLFVTGERLAPELANRWLTKVKGVPLVNAYGPTEASDDVAHHVLYGITSASNVPVGTVVPNLRIYLLNGHDQLVPIGAKGEICVSGAGVGRGYLNQVENTSSCFVPDPFIDGERMYKTGDMGYWREEGLLEYAGRNDDQVKINGHRIELGEIEYIIMRMPGIKNAVVKAHIDSNERTTLAAYLVIGESLDPNSCEHYLRNFLPSHMIPSFWITMDAIPLTPNGKTDRSKLPVPDVAGGRQTPKSAHPKTRLEKELYELCKEILQVEHLDTNDDFFDRGGNSLLAVRLMLAIQRKYNLNGVGVADLFNYPTISELCRFIGKTSRTDHRLIKLNRDNDQSRTLYLAPPIVGIPLAYKGLSRTLENYFRSFGLQYKGVNRDETPDETIEEMSVRAAEDIYDFQKAGIVYLAGYSFGVIIAFEAAKLLEAMGLGVKLILIDWSPALAITPSGERGDTDMEGKLVSEEQQFFLDKYVEEGDKQRILELVRRNWGLQRRYTTRGILNAPILALETWRPGGVSAMANWRDFTKGAVSHSWIEGGHSEIFKKEYLPGLAGTILDGLDALHNINTNNG
jgi:amino acid adenylation domain-containing protein